MLLVYFEFSWLKCIFRMGWSLIILQKQVLAFFRKIFSPPTMGIDWIIWNIKASTWAQDTVKGWKKMTRPWIFKKAHTPQKWRKGILFYFDEESNPSMWEGSLQCWGGKCEYLANSTKWEGKSRTNWGFAQNYLQLQFSRLMSSVSTGWIGVTVTL